MKRLFAVFALLITVAGCRDGGSPLEPQQVIDPRFHNGGCVGDLHFGDNCASVTGEEGSHFRLFHVSWRPVGTNKAEFSYTIALRRSFYGGVSVGQNLNLANLNFGDGTAATVSFTVQHVDVSGDWFLAKGAISKQYAGAGPYTAFSDDCCRVGRFAPWWHQNNPDGWSRIETRVNFAVSTGSPSTSLPALIPCARNSVCTFNVAGTAPDGQLIRWRMATQAEMGSGTGQPVGASVDPATGVFSWNTTGAATGSASYRTVYSTQVVMETMAGATVTSKSAVDFLIELTDQAQNQSPVFIAPTPADGSVFELQVGQNLSFQISGSDPDAADVVTLSALNLPPGASFTPAPPLNPVHSFFTWTPDAAVAGNSYVINLLAQDNRGASASPRSIIIRVVANQRPIANAGLDRTVNRQTAAGASVTLDGSLSSDPDGSITDHRWFEGATEIGSGPAPTVLLGLGTHTIKLVVKDNKGASAEDFVVITVLNVAPTVSISLPQTLQCVNGGAQATFSAQGQDVDGTITYLWSTPNSTNSFFAPLGNTPVAVTVQDNDGAQATASSSVTVMDNQPPTISMSVSTALWPPNHKMVKVASGISSSDGCYSTSGLTLGVTVTSNEPVNGLGDGDTAPDWNVVQNANGTYDVYVRAERSGTGTGRIYTITATSTDGSGNTSTKTGTVTVAHSQGR